MSCLRTPGAGSPFRPLCACMTLPDSFAISVTSTVRAPSPYTAANTVAPSGSRSDPPSYARSSIIIDTSSTLVAALAPTSREVGLRDSELEKLEGRKELFILYFIKTNVICALRTACVRCAVVGGH
jgi:hypothetical protein